MKFTGHPLLTRFALRQFRRSPLDQASKDAIDAALGSPEALAQIGDLLDDAVLTHAAGGNVGQLGDGTIIRLLLDQLPEIMAAILEILKLLAVV